MKTVIQVLVLALFTTSAMAAGLKPAAKNLPLAKKIAKIDGADGKIYYLFGSGSGLDPKTLKKDASKVYRKANKEFRSAEKITVSELNNMELIHVVDSVEGNGCEDVFNMSGEFLNAICGTESSEWTWAIK